ncbi:hypothetical protein B0J11DRAFT_583543 [Dendryphion nanum]|uniref:Uncharacterized protein n=1 Tax=Dendryphion nanum TaxID=256645 RepID=A0A9P9DDJ8_9PLEO|nr:hypothetical protein B0J11DRAFT_583543 [Dendryphion nanum]
MSSSLMDTEPGGEQTQYEAEASDTIPHKKEPGQFGNASEGTQLADQHPSKPPNAPNTQGITPADKIRYGQAIQEGGAGGKTEGGLKGGIDEGKAGDANVEAREGRKVQGYGGENEMRRDVGA